MATSTMMLLPLCTRQVVSWGGEGSKAAGRAEGTYLGQERGDEDEEDVVDEEDKQQQSAGLWEVQPHAQDLRLGPTCAQVLRPPPGTEPTLPPGSAHLEGRQADGLQHVQAEGNAQGVLQDPCPPGRRMLAQ